MTAVEVALAVTAEECGVLYIENAVDRRQFLRLEQRDCYVVNRHAPCSLTFGFAVMCMVVHDQIGSMAIHNFSSARLAHEWKDFGRLVLDCVWKRLVLLGKIRRHRRSDRQRLRMGRHLGRSGIELR